MSPVIDDLRIEAEIPPKSVRPGAVVAVSLRFSNIGTRLRTLFLIVDEAYRFGQSTFQLQIGSGPPLVQPPRRAGYVPTAADFHELPPRGRLEFKQTLRLPRDIPLGDHTVLWVYDNEVSTLPQSAVTPGGKLVAPIWVGHIEDGFTVNVMRALVTRRSPG
jgi:hypothetical protein